MGYKRLRVFSTVLVRVKVRACIQRGAEPYRVPWIEGSSVHESNDGVSQDRQVPKLI